MVVLRHPLLPRLVSSPAGPPGSTDLHLALNHQIVEVLFVYMGF